MLLRLFFKFALFHCQVSDRLKGINFPYGIRAGGYFKDLDLILLPLFEILDRHTHQTLKVKLDNLLVNEETRRFQQ